MTASPADLLDPDVPFNQRLLTNDLQKTLTQLNAVNFNSVRELIVNAALSFQENDPSTSNERVEGLKELLENVIKQQQRLDDHKQGLLSFGSELNDVPYQRFCHPDYDWSASLSDSIRRVSEASQTAHARQLQQKLVDFHQEITGFDADKEEEEGMDLDGDGDVIIEKEIAYDKCPITQGPLTDAMKSTKCNHKFSKAGIDSLLSRRPLMPCPVSGCKHSVSRDCLRRCHPMASQRR